VNHRYALVFLFAAALTISGQQEPLPAVTPRTSPLIIDTAPAVVLASEPLHELHTPTLIEAARANDYLTFDALYREGRARGESLAQFTTLHELWTYAITSPIGAFYGRDLYERLSRAYPGYSPFIDEYRIVDNNGDEWWPTSETRTFLVARAVEGRAPRVLIADSRVAPPIPARATTERSTDHVSVVEAPAPISATRASQADRARASRTDHTSASRADSTRASRTGAPASSPAEQAASRRRVAPSTPARVTAAPASKAPAIAAPPTQEAARDAARSAGEDAGAPNVTHPAAAVETSAATPVTSVQSASVPAATPIARTPSAAVPPLPAAPPPAPRESRGMLLLVLGVIGVGMLAVLLRTPSEQPQQPADQSSSPVEPIRRQAAQGEKKESSRATGSHG
jgi:hypothetical protein